MKTIKNLDFGILFFASGEDALQGDKYRFLLNCAKYADDNGLSSVWIPERHFTKFGCLYPNPAVLHAAVAMTTQRVRLCAGSVVMPLHNPVRIAEEWSVVDNLSNGRVGVSIAPGWNPNDFAFFPDKYAARKTEMLRSVETVQRIWRGETIHARNGAGKVVELRVYPTPVQPELPIWVTAAGNPETFIKAGELGANVLTHLLDQDVQVLGEKIALYRDARARYGHDPEAGIVTAMTHTFIGQDAEATRETARAPYCSYLKSNLDLAKGLAHNRGHKIDFDKLAEKDIDQFLNFLYDRFVFERALIGSVDTCEPLAVDLFRAGVDEIAALLDFGPPEDQALANLAHLAALKDRCRGLSENTHSRDDLPITVETVASADARAASERVEITSSSLDDSLDAIQSRCGEELLGSDWYRSLDERRQEIASQARGLEQVWRRDGEALGRFSVAVSSEHLETKADPTSRALELGFQVALAALPAEEDGSFVPYLILRVDSMDLGQDLGLATAAHARLRPSPAADAATFFGDLRLLDGLGREVGTASGVELQKAEVLLGAADQIEEGVEDWLYKIHWESRPITATRELEAGNWLILADRHGIGRQVASVLGSQGHSCRVVTVEDYRTQPLDEGEVQGGFFRPLLDELLAPDQPRCLGVLHFWSLDATAPEDQNAVTLIEDQVLSCGSAVQVIQAIASREGIKKPLLWVYTRGVHPIHPTERLAVSQAPIWAIGRTCASEHPDLWGGLVDLDPTATVELAAEQAVSMLSADDRENQVGFSGGERRVLRLVPTTAEPAPPLEIKADGAYLITGGLQGVGLEIARWLVQKGARQLVLIGRTVLPPRGTWDDLPADSPVASRVAGILALERLGAELRFPSIDISDEAKMRGFVASYRADGGAPIRGVFHAASVWRDREGLGIVGPLARVTLASFRQVLPPKISGSWVLREIFGDEPDFYTWFSAGAAVIGSAGQGNYAAGNAFLDSFAHDASRRSKSRHLAINWGPVTDVGFGTSPEGLAVHTIWERRGIRGIPPQAVLDALDLLIPQSEPQIAVMRTDWALLRRSYADMLSSPWSSHLVEGGLEVEAVDLLELLRNAPPTERKDLLAEQIQQQVVVVMGFESTDVPDRNQGLFELGLDSLLALELKNRIQSALKHEVPATALFDHPTIDALVDYLLRDVLALPTTDDGGDGGGVAALRAPADVLSEIEEMSEEEVERLLAERVLAGGASSV